MYDKGPYWVHKIFLAIKVTSLGRCKLSVIVANRYIIVGYMDTVVGLGSLGAHRAVVPAIA